MKRIQWIIRKLFHKDEGYSFIYEVKIYPHKVKGNLLDCRMDYNKPYMLVSFNYIHEPEKDERIIRSVEKRFRDLPELEGEKLPTVREVLTAPSHETTTCFEEKISLS
jgi:hypothetical protein